jgi:GNAT superfamily N-acetyltransferase
MQFTVRRAVVGDEPVLIAVRLQALTDSPGAFSSTYERELARTTDDWRRWLVPGVTFLLEAGGEACGMVAGVRDAQDSSVVHLMAMWVHPNHRGTGAADALVSSVKVWAAEVGATQVRLNVVESNGRLDDVTNALAFVLRVDKAWSRKMGMWKLRWRGTE